MNTSRSLLQKLGEGFVVREVLHLQPSQDALLLGFGSGVVSFPTAEAPTFSEDVFDDLWEEVVGRGQAFYEDVLEYPDVAHPWQRS